MVKVLLIFLAGALSRGVTGSLLIWLSRIRHQRKERTHFEKANRKEAGLG